MTTALIRRHLSDAIERVPALYLALQRFRYRNTQFHCRIVTPKHALMIEGFPRSGNSFAVRAFKSCNGDAGIKLATHLHTAAHAVMAIHYGVPTMVLIRDPAEAIVSAIALGAQVGSMRIANTSVQTRVRLMQHTTLRYSRFYSKIAALGDSVQWVSFEEVTTDFGAVMRRFNARFGTGFAPFEHTQENVAAIFRTSKVHLSPNHERNAIKAGLRAVYYDDANAAARTEAECIHHALGNL